MIDFENSIVLIGQDEISRNMIARKLADEKNYIFIPCYELEFLPQFFEIKARLTNPKISQEEREYLLNVKKMREKFPEIKNLVYYGYNEVVAKYLRHKFSPEIALCYQKQYESLVLQDILNKSTGKCVISLSSEMATALTNELSQDLQEFKEKQGELYNMAFNEVSQIDNDTLKNKISKFKNIVYLSLPKNVKNYNERINNLKDNEIVAENIFKKIVKLTLNIDDLIDDNGKINNEILNKNCDKIKNLIKEYNNELNL